MTAPRKKKRSGVERVGDSWRINYRDAGGKRRYKHLPVEEVPTERQAQDVRDELRRQERRIRQGLELAPVHVTVEAAAKRYLEACKTSKASWDSQEGRFRRHVLPTLGKLHLHRVTPAQVDALLEAKRLEGYSGQQLRHIYNDLGALYEWARGSARLFTGETPMRYVKAPIVPKKRPRALALEHVAAASVASKDPGLSLLIASGAMTGARRSELFRARVGDIDLAARVWHLRGTKTEAADAPVPMPTALADMLAPWLEGKDEDELVFPGPDGKERSKHMKTARLLRSALSQAGIVGSTLYRCHQRRRAAGVRNGRSRLQPGQAEAIRERSAQGATRAELAREYGISPAAVRRIALGQLWKKPAQAKAPEGCGYTDTLKELPQAQRLCPRCGLTLKAKALPPDAQFKDLRSSWATHLSRATGGLRVARQVLRHTTEATTARHYDAHDMDHLLEAVDRVRLPLPQVAKKSPTPAENTLNETSAVASRAVVV